MSPLPPMRAAWRDPWVYAVVLFSVASCVPTFRVLSGLADEGVILHAVARMLAGQVPYVDFFEILAPGGLLLTAGWLVLFGATFESARVLSILTVTAIATLTYQAVRLVSGHRSVALVLALGWVVLARGEIVHHWFTTALCMAAAVAVLLAIQSEAPARASCFASGLFAGAAFTTTQTRGALLVAGVLAIFAITPHRRFRLPLAVAGMLVAPAVMVGYLAAVGALWAGIDDVVVFPLRHYSDVQHVPLGTFVTTEHAAVVAFFPLTLAFAAAAGALGMWRAAEFRASLLVAVAGFLGAYPRPDLAHLFFVMPLLMPLFALCLMALLQALRPRLRLVLGALLLVVAAWHLGTASIGVIDIARIPAQRIDTPRGAVASYPGVWTSDLASLVGLIAARSSRGDGFFFYPNAPMLPYLTARRHVGQLDVMIPGYTTAEQYHAVCTRVVAQAQWVVIDRIWMDTERLMTLLPTLADPNPPARQAFERMLERGFERIDDLRIFEVRRRTPAAVASLCGARS